MAAALATLPAGSHAAPSPGVGVLTLRFTDPTRLVRLAHRPVAPRALVTVIRYPTAPTGSAAEVRQARPARGRFPLIVFAHGFDSLPARYAALLDTWVRAGFVVAAPIFPLTNARAPGGARESDLVNQPTDMSVVISRLLTLDATGRGILHGLLDGSRIAVAGQSDGGSTALAAADNAATADHRIDAAIILSGARIPGFGAYTFPPPTPPLLAVQGTADDSNAPASTRAYFRIAPPPKFLLWLWGAGHLPPYTVEQPQLSIVERVTIDFLDRYLERDGAAAARMWSDGNIPGVSNLSTHS
jgi:predicted dienelactone hydrolase